MLIKKLSLILSLFMISSIAFADASEAVIDSGDGTLFNAITLDEEGNPVLAYWNLNEGELRVARCTDPNCQGSIETSSIAEGNAGFFFLNIVLDAENRPYVSYYDNESESVKIAICEDASCDEVTTLPLFESSGQESAIQLDENGYPVIAYYTGSELRLIRCEAAACEESTTNRIVEDNSSSNPSLDLQLDAEGSPMIAFARNISEDLNFFHCDSASCDGLAAIVPIDDDDFGSIDQISMAVNSEGNAVIAYYSLADNGLMLAICDDAFCGDVSVQKITEMRTSANISLALDEEDRPIIAYLEAIPGDLHLLSCSDAECEDSQDTPLSYKGQFVNLVLDADYYPVISLDNFGSRDKGLAVIHCDSRNCE
jgi:hypothetical protein